MLHPPPVYQREKPATTLSKYHFSRIIHLIAFWCYVSASKLNIVFYAVTSPLASWQQYYYPINYVAL